MTAIRHSSQRVAVFVDVANLYHSAKHLFSGRVNFAKLLEEAVADRDLVRSFAYVVTTGDPDEQPFLDALTKAQFEIKAKDLQVFAGGAKKGDWDIGIAMDIIRLAPSVDAVVLATGDGDFVPLVQYVQAHYGVQVEVMAFSGSMADALKEAADDFTDIGESKFLISIPGKGRSSRNSGKNNGNTKGNSTKKTPKKKQTNKRSGQRRSSAK